MYDIEISKQWLDDQFNQLQSTDSFLEAIDEFRNELKEIFFAKLNQQKWCSTEFFVLALAFNIVEILSNPHLYQSELRANDFCLRKLTSFDINTIIIQFNAYLNETLPLFNQLIEANKLTNVALPIEWLELTIKSVSSFYIQRKIICYREEWIDLYLMPELPLGQEKYKNCYVLLNMQELNYIHPPEITEKIDINPSVFITHLFDSVISKTVLESYLIEPKPTKITLSIEIFKRLIQASEGKFERKKEPRVEVKLNGMIELVTSEMAESIRFHHYNIDPKIAKEGIFPVFKFNYMEAAKLVNLNPDNLIATCFKEEIGVYLKKGKFQIKKIYGAPISQSGIKIIAEASYVYPYKGLVRLMKAQKNISSPYETLEIFYEGGTFSCPEDNNFVLIPLQPSLSECILGIRQYIELRRNQKITEEDLVFTENELEDFKAMQTNDYTPPGNSYYTNENERFYKKIGTNYEILFNGERAIINATYGATYIEYLLVNPNKEIHVNALEQLPHQQYITCIDPEDIQVMENSLHQLSVTTEKSNQKAIRAVKDQLKNIKEELGELELSDDIYTDEFQDKIETLLIKRKKLNDYLRDVEGKYGAIRAIDDETEKARKRVWRAIQDVLDKLEKNGHYLIHTHLANPNILSRGEYCVYKKLEGQTNWKN